MRAEFRFEAASLLTCALATIAFIVVLQATGLSFSVSGSSGVLIPILILLGLSLTYRTIRSEERIASVSFALGALLWAAAIVGGIALAASSWRLPFVDAQLAAADAAIGVNVVSLTKLIAACPSVAHLLNAVYLASIPGLAVLACGLALADRTHRLKEFTLVFVLTITFCSLVGIVVPAEGAFSFLHMPQETMMRLPAGAGIFYMDALQAYRSGQERVIDFSRLEGVITFPSFHLCMALLFSYAVRGMRMIFWPMTVFSGLTVVSIFPIGGHYAVDAIGGGAVFAISVVIANWIGASDFGLETWRFRRKDLQGRPLKGDALEKPPALVESPAPQFVRPFKSVGRIDALRRP